MTTFGDYVSTSDALVFTLYGQSATYTPKGGDGQAVTAVLGDEVVETETDDIGRRYLYTTDALITLADIATPVDAIGGTLTVGSDVWTISRVISQDENATTFEIWTESDQRRHGEEQYRRIK